MVNFCCFLLVLLIEISTHFLMSIPFVIKIVIRLILLTCIGSLVLKKAAKKAAVPTAIRQSHKGKAFVKAGEGLLQVMEQLGISKASYYGCLGGCVG